MATKIIPFQQEAEADLSSKMLRALKNSRKGFEILLQAPTGAGKTKMVSNSLLQVNKELEAVGILATYIWIAPRTLHTQSFDRIKQFFKESNIRCYLLENTSELYFKENTVCFFNWDSINKKGNILIKDTEQESGLSQKLKKTRSKKIKIVAIIDESHFAAGAAGSSQVLSTIDPDLIVKVTATPSATSDQEKVYVDRARVIEEGMIREAIVINPSSILKYSAVGKDSLELEVAIDKQISPQALIVDAVNLQKELKSLYAQEGSNIEPLILVQFPDSTSYGPDVNKLKNEILTHLLSTEGWQSGQEIAQWFDTVKVGLDLDSNGESLVSFSSSVKVLFFKQAIALGWDCPRAQILVELRELKSDTFKIQVLGRILRQPEHKRYTNPALNRGYVLTNNKVISIKGESAGLFTSHFSHIRNEFQNESLEVPLPYCFYKNLDERNFLRQDVIQDFISHLEACSSMFKWSPTYTENLISDYVIEALDAAETGKLIGHSVAGFVTGDTLSLAYDLFFKAQLFSLADMYQGRKYLKEGWERFFKVKFKTELAAYLRDKAGTTNSSDEFLIREATYTKQAIRACVFERTNKDLIERCLSNAIDAHLIKYEPPGKKQIQESTTWTIPSSQEYPIQKDAVRHHMKCLYQFQAGLNELEKDFANYLDKHPQVRWWFKNRDSGKQNFAIKYVDENNKESLFFPDFIVKYIDGSFGIYDPKGWGREGTAMSINTSKKINALFKYTNNIHAKNIKVYSGVIVKKLEHLYAFLNTQGGYPYPVIEDLSGWSKLT